MREILSTVNKVWEFIATVLVVMMYFPEMTKVQSLTLILVICTTLGEVALKEKAIDCNEQKIKALEKENKELIKLTCSKVEEKKPKTEQAIISFDTNLHKPGNFS